MATAKKLKSGNWRIRIFAGKNHDPQYVSFTAVTKKEAEYYAAAWALEQRQYKTLDISVGDAMNRYIESKDNVLSPSTIWHYKRIRKNNIQDIMNIKLKKLTQEDVQIVINKEALTHAPKSVRNMHGLLSAVIKTYRPSMTLNTTLPQKTKSEVHIPSESDIKKIYHVVKETEMELPFLLASQCGLRAGEISALMPDCISDDGITVKHSMVLTPDGLKQKAPKSTSGYRYIPADAHIISLCRNISKGRIVLLSPDTITKRWEHVLKRAGIEHFNFHKLRHYFASQALLQGIPQKYVIELMGHISGKMLDEIYQHTFPDAKKAFGEKMKCLTRQLYDTKHDT